jgi:hypothetical protein
LQGIRKKGNNHFAPTRSLFAQVENPKEPIEEAVVKAAMEEMIASGVFTSANGNFASVKGARVIDRNVTEYEII